MTEKIRTRNFGHDDLAGVLVDVGTNQVFLRKLRESLKIGIPLQLKQFLENQNRLKAYTESHDETFNPETSAWTKYIQQAKKAILCLTQNKQFDYLGLTIPASLSIKFY